MTDRAHIFGGNLIRTYNGEAGAVNYQKKRLCSPVIIGWEDNGHKIVPASEIINDASTGPDTVRTSTGWVVAGDESEVTRTIDIRDKTAQEIDDENEAVVDEFDSTNHNLLVWLGLFVKDITAQQFSLINDVRNRHGQQPITLTQYANSLSSQANQDLFTKAQFKAQVKARGE